MTPSECIDKILDTIKEKGLAGLLRDVGSHPIQWGLCITILLHALFVQLNGGSINPDPESPVFGATEDIDEQLFELAPLLGIPMPDTPEGAQSSVVIQLIIKQVIAELLRILIEGGGFPKAQG